MLFNQLNLRSLLLSQPKRLLNR